MKKRITQILLIVAIASYFVPLSASGFGGYYAIKGEKTYHSVLCDELYGYELENLLWFETEREAKNAGFKKSECCIDSGFDYEKDDSTTLFSKDTKIQNALELERFNGIIDGYKGLKDEFYDDWYNEGYSDGIVDGKEDGYNELKDEFYDDWYNEGYSAGTSDGKEDGYKEGYDVGYEDGVKSEKPDIVSILFSIGIPCVIAYWIGSMFSNKELRAENVKLKQENDDLKKMLNQNRISSN